MKIGNFQQFLKYCQRFSSRMNEENIPTNMKKAMLRAYIAGYITRNGYKIHLQDNHITELIS